jgi:serine/threonine protein kinase
MVILSLVALLAMLLLGLVGRWWYVKYRRAALAQTEIPDYTSGDRKCTLRDILSNPKINYIPIDAIRITGKLGAGAMGSVSSGIWSRSRALGSAEDIPVAIKELHAIFDFTDDVVQEFMKEIVVTSALQHKNVVKFIGVSSRGDNELLLLTEIMERGSLQSLLMKKGRNMPWRLRLKLALDAAKGMAYLHHRKLIHRDIKTGTSQGESESERAI